MGSGALHFSTETSCCFHLKQLLYFVNIPPRPSGTVTYMLLGFTRHLSKEEQTKHRENWGDVCVQPCAREIRPTLDSRYVYLVVYTGRCGGATGFVTCLVREDK